MLVRKSVCPSLQILFCEHVHAGTLEQAQLCSEWGGVGVPGWRYSIIMTYVPLGSYQGLRGEHWQDNTKRTQLLAADEPLILSTVITGAWWALGTLSRSS